MLNKIIKRKHATEMKREQQQKSYNKIKGEFGLIWIVMGSNFQDLL